MSKFHRAELLAGIIMAMAVSSGHAVDQQAIDKAIGAGVKALRSMQMEDGTWPPHREMGAATQIGATALAGLALLECGAKSDDSAVLRAADALRKAGPRLTHNYSICLSILFFDRLGDPGDMPLIEALTVRLLAGQSSTGGWNYFSPPVPEAEVRRLQTKLASRKELVGQRDMPKPGGPKRSAKDLSPEIRQQLGLLTRTGGMAVEMGSDNSNTQFATLALWVARRYGLPVENALQRVEKRFRSTQRSEGGWGYFDPNKRVGPELARSTASMTCAGLLGLAVADAEMAERANRRPDAKPVRDAQIRKGLLALSTAIGDPVETNSRRRSIVPTIGGRTYYFLWGLERVAVALDLKTIGKKDWYAWGAEILLANQQSDGSWQGTYGGCGADTCFAVLFLKRANLAPDLTSQFAGRVPDPGERILKRGEIGEGIAERGNDNSTLPSGLEDKNTKSNTDGRYPAEVAKEQQSRPTNEPKQEKPIAKSQSGPSRSEPGVPAAGSSAPKPPAAPNRAADATGSPAAQLAADLARSTGTKHGLLLNVYRERKGAQFTEALALAIPQLSGDLQKKTREALAERLTRMKDTTLKEYLGDENLEIRIAAARACAIKSSKPLVPQLIPLLRDTRGGVAEAAHQALKDLSGQDFGPKANASREERLKATGQWSDWWKKQSDKSEPRP
jgi:hypothetical protein